MKTLLVFVFVYFCGILIFPAEGLKARYDNYQVFRFWPKTETELKVLSSLSESFPEIMFWKGPSQVERFVDVMMPPYLHEKVISILKLSTLQVPEPYIENVQALIDEEEAASIKGRSRTLQFGWEAYYDYEDMLEFMQSLIDKLPDNVESSLHFYGRSFEGKDLTVIRISDGGNGTRPVIWIDANIHGREWITSAVATFIINELLDVDGSATTDIKSLLSTFDFYVIPVVNPDGYQYSRTMDRMWKKTRSNYAEGTCRGADANHNFEFNWNQGGSSNLCVAEDYMGISNFSEPETRALAVYYNATASRISAYLSLHSYGQLILVPWGTEVNGSRRVTDYNRHMTVGRCMETAIKQKSNTQFQTGNLVDMVGTSSGGSADWVKGVHNTTLTYTLELQDTGRYGFILPPDKIIESAEELIDGIIAMGKMLRSIIRPPDPPEDLRCPPLSSL